MPKVSVIIPTHNRAELLRSAITSVLNQTYQDFEVIVVDDASTDETRGALASFNDPRIKYIRHAASKGDAGARNTGIVNSTGDYIAFLDDDDQWLSEKLELQAAVLENSPGNVGGVYTGHFEINGADGKISNVSFPTRRGDLSQCVFMESFIFTSCVLLKRQCFQKLGLFDESIPYCSDYDMWIRVAKEFHFEYVSKPLVKYLIHKAKLTNNLKLSIKGKEMILNKYGVYFDRHRKAYGQRYRTLGELYCYDGNIKKGREALLKSIKIDPFEIRSYCHYCLSFLGPKNFKILKESVGRLLSPVRKKKLNSELRRWASQSSETKYSSS